MVFFTIGTGIGGGVVTGGRLHLGPLGAAGEIGHQTLIPDGPLCGCGNRGCLEALASGPALTGEGVRLLRAGLAPRLWELTGGDANAVTPERMGEAAGSDSAVAAAIERASRFIGVAVANVVTILHPELVVLGGGVAGLGERLLQPVREELRRRVRMFPVDDVRVELSALPGRAGALGGIALAAGKNL
jgi:glucokinase